MPQWIENLSLLQAILGVSAAVAPIAWRYAIKPAVAFIRRLNAMGLQVQELSASMVQIQATLGPNGGRSLYDRVTAAGKSAVFNQALMSTMVDVVVDRPVFEADAKGLFSRVNVAFEKIYETSCDEMADRGWINLLIPEDRDRVIRDYYHAVSDGRSFSTPARVLTIRNGILIVAKFSARPVRDPSSDVVIGWMGAIDPLPSDAGAMQVRAVAAPAVSA